MIVYRAIPLALQKYENTGHNSVSAIKTTVGLTLDKNEWTQNGISKTHCPNETEHEFYTIDDEFYPKICLYGFKTKDNTNKTISADIYFLRSVLYKSGKMQWGRDTCNCKNIKRFNSNF